MQEIVQESNKYNLSYSRLLILLFSLIIYLPSLSFDFTYDDFPQIVKSDYVTSVNNSIIQIFSIFQNPTPPGDLYRPITSLSLRINYLISGLAPWSYHLFNILLNALIAVLIFQLLKRLRFKTITSLIITLIFSAHPLHIEAVANIYNRTELLANFFSLLGIHLILYHSEQAKLKFLLLALISFLLGFLSKESALTSYLLTPLCLFYQQNNLKLGWSKAKPYLVYLLIPAIFYLLLRYLILSNNFLIKLDLPLFVPENPLLGLNYPNLLLSALVLLGKYIYLTIIPINQAIDYSLAENDFYFFFSSLESLYYLFIVFSLICCLIIFKKSKKTVFGILWFLFSISLSWNFPFTIGTIFAERLTFLPSLGIIILLFSLLEKTHFSNVSKLSLAISYLFFLLILFWSRLPIWVNQDVLLQQSVLDRSHNPKLAYSKGIEHKKNKEYHLCSQSLEQSLANDPNWPISISPLITCKYLEGKPQEALWWVNYFLSDFPGDAKMLNKKKFIENKINQSDMNNKQ